MVGGMILSIFTLPAAQATFSTGPTGGEVRPSTFISTKHTPK